MTAARVATAPRPRRMDPKSRGLAAAFAAPNLPAALQPTEKDRCFQIALLWQGNQLLDIARLEESGRQPPRPLPLADELLPAASVPRIQNLPGGKLALLIPADALATIGRGDQHVGAKELMSLREAEPVEVPFRGSRYVLRTDDRLELSVGSLQLIGRYMRPERAPQRPLQERIDPLFISWLTIGAVALAFVLGMFRLALMAGIEIEDGPLVKTRPQVVISQPVPPPTIREQPRLASGVEGTAGDRRKPPRPGGPTQGSPSHRPPSLGARAESFFRALDELAATGVVLGSSGNTHLQQALNGIHPGSDVAAYGSEGWGPRGPGPGGGGHELALPSFGSPNGVPAGRRYGISIGAKPHTPFDPSRVLTVGGLDKDTVGRIIRRHWNEIRYCYEKELNKDPNLAGKVGMRFQIGPVGEVVLADVTESDLGSQAVEQCMVVNVRRWVFPAPKGGGLVDVNYPFIFQSSH